MKTILKSLTGILLLLLMTACSKEYLDPVPKTSLSDLSVFDNADRILAQVNGIYDRMKSGQYLGGRYFIYNDIRAENFENLLSNGVTGKATYDHTLIGSTNEVQNLWGAVYAAVNAINIFNDGLKERWDAGQLDGIISQAQYNQYVSEALTLRALCYFHMLQLYAKPYNMGNGANPGLPLRLTAQKSSADNDLARSTVAEVYTQILKDLNDAEPQATLDHGSVVLNTTRVHKNTIIAIKTRVYLHMSNWSGVTTEAQKIVTATAPFRATTGVQFGLQANMADVFASPYTTNESIFSMPFTTSDLPGTQNGLGQYYNPGPAGNNDYSVNTADAWALYSNPGFDASDARRAMFVNNTDGKVYFAKFPTGPNSTDWAPVIRYAEVVLNYAEAIVRGGNAVTQQAVDLLNAVRGRSFPAGTYTLGSFANVQAFINAILLERNIEFMGEGLRNLDIMRTGASIPGKFTVSSILSTQTEYIWPIPTSELNINKLMVGN
ncbi:MAG TPA: RagB/SusD family nutrient uptake outer membrane protein [Bacteroidales bacterium]|nr:RagB/SusD family nutrient uptake outer membrane protein [Bacteroidales bacterium]